MDNLENKTELRRPESGTKISPFDKFEHILFPEIQATGDYTSELYWPRGVNNMARFEEIRRILCRNDHGRSVVIIEQQKWPVYAAAGGVPTPVFDYMTEDGDVANRVGDNQFLLLLSDEMLLTT